MSWSAPVYTDGLTGMARCSLPVYSSPIPGDKTEYILKEKWRALRTKFSTTALDTAHGEDATFYLVSESERVDVGGGMVEWERTYAKIPSAWSDYQTIAYPFPGLYGTYGAGVTDPTGRARYTAAVQSRIYHEYYLCATGQTYTTPGAILILPAQRFRQVVGTYYTDVDWLSDSPPFLAATSPSRATYLGYMQNTVDYGWGGGNIQYVWPTAGGAPTVTEGTHPCQIIAKDSAVERWMGNIWVRRTTYVLAQ